MPGVDVITDPQPSTGMLTVLSLAVAAGLGVTVPVVLENAAEHFNGGRFVLAATFAAMLLVGGIVHWRAGGGSTVVGLIGKAALYTVWVLSAGYVILGVWVAFRDIELEEYASDIYIVAAVWALTIFLLAALYLSSVRAAAHRIRVR